MGLERLYGEVNKKNQIAILNKFLSHDYEPPDDLKELLNHISSIYFYQNLFSQSESIPLNGLLQLELVLSKLMQKAKYESTVFALKTRHDTKRLAKSRKKMSESIIENSEKVIGIYEGLKERHPNKKLNSLAKIIEKQLPMKLSTETIKSYIKRFEEKRTKTFESEKIYYLKGGQIRKK